MGIKYYRQFGLKVGEVVSLKEFYQVEEVEDEEVVSKKVGEKELDQVQEVDEEGSVKEFYQVQEVEDEEVVSKKVWEVVQELLQGGGALRGGGKGRAPVRSWNFRSLSWSCTTALELWLRRKRSWRKGWCRRWWRRWCFGGGRKEFPREGRRASRRF